jgi:GrpB-like predicted nucleotidyltransferase (UPF0157 family)
VDVPAVVVPYDPRWPAWFERIRTRVDAALDGLAHETVHVGSTAVPGLAAKPIIDIDIVVADRRAVRAAIDSLAAAGWRHQGDNGIAGREAFAPPEDSVYHHLYVVVDGDEPHRDHVDFRDYLRAQPGQAARYGELKRQLAPLLVTDRLAYGDAKAGLIAEFLVLARAKSGSPAREAPSREAPAREAGG